MKLHPPRTSIRSKLLLVALALLLIPWMGYQYVREMKSFLLQGQENALLLTARAISTVLHNRPELFNPETDVPKLIGEDRDLYAYPLSRYIQLDGLTADWEEFLDQARRYTNEYRLECKASYDPESLSFSNVLGYRGRYLYALFRVKDDVRVYRDLRYRRLDNSDHLRITLQDPYGQVTRYLLSGSEPGRLSTYLMDPDWRSAQTGEPLYDVRGVWRETDEGYVIEVRFPRFMISANSRLAFAVVDVDDPAQRQVDRVISTSPKPGAEKLGRVLLQSPEIIKILKGLDRPIARIWILDQELRVRALVGNLQNPGGTTVASGDADPATSWLHDRLSPVYRLILKSPAKEFRDVSGDVTHRKDAALRRVLTGQPQTERRPSLDRRTEILMAAQPIWTGGEVSGVVVVEQSSNEVLGLQNQALENVVSVTLLVFLVVTAALITFASRLTLRIRSLRDAAEDAIGPEGRVRHKSITAEAHARDEIGDLSRSISDMLKRLHQHTRYLEAMPDTLAHELSNPLNVVNSSLDNLQQLVPKHAEGGKYIERAKNGITRLGAILTDLTEAASLEEALNAGEGEQFFLDELVTSYVGGYRLSHPDRVFTLEIPQQPLPMYGKPDHIAQMLDKLIDNAVDFGAPQTPIVIRVVKNDSHAKLHVLNEGALLPDGMRARLFDPMVSVGKKRANQSRLGLGLYVVRLIAEFHRGKIEAANRKDVKGAVFTVHLPLSSVTP